MHNRIRHLIDLKADGNKSKFASLLGWSPQYLNGILCGKIGLKPIASILEVFPDVDARWLILGHQSSEQLNPIAVEIQRLLWLDKYVPVMSTLEQDMYIRQGLTPDAETELRWENDLILRNQDLTLRIIESMQRSQLQ